MKDYRTSKSKNLDYIVDVTYGTKSVPTEEEGKSRKYKTLNIKFADGKVFRNIASSQDNLNKINDQQERQVEEGIKNIPTFVKRTKMSGVACGASVGVPILGSGIAAMAENILNTEIDPVKLGVGLGVITLFSIIPSAYSIIKNYKIVDELEKLRYRNEHRALLEGSVNYENAYTGISKEKAAKFQSDLEAGCDPFAAIEVDKFTRSDLETIVANVTRENVYQFTYVPNRPVPGKTSSTK